MKLSTFLSNTLAALACVWALGACGGDAPAGSTDSSAGQFLAFPSNFTGYHGWKAFSFDSAMPQATPDGSVVHTNGPRTEYFSALPPHGSTSFPVGTMIVKELEGGDASQHRVFAMVKRGGSYNASGASGWEWWELENGPNDTVTQVWRGIGPTGADPYSTTGAGPQVCNSCHAAAKDNDSVLSQSVVLKDL